MGGRGSQNLCQNDVLDKRAKLQQLCRSGKTKQITVRSNTLRSVSQSHHRRSEKT